MHAENVNNLTHYRVLSLGHVRNVRATDNVQIPSYYDLHVWVLYPYPFHRQGHLGARGWIGVKVKRGVKKRSL